MKRAVLIVLLAFIGVWAALLLGGCATTGPTPFELGDEAPPPMGCIQGRARGVDC
jgi:hypothetical protein